jgi:hypothetical protein
MTSTTPPQHQVQHPDSAQRQYSHHQHSQHQQLAQPHVQPLHQPWSTAPGAVALSRPVEPAAVVSLVLGTVTLVAGCVPGVSVLALIGAVVAVVYGAVALRRLRSGEKTGRGLAITGLSCGSVAVVVAGAMSVLFVLWAALMSGSWALLWGTLFL